MLADLAEAGRQQRDQHEHERAAPTTDSSRRPRRRGESSSGKRLLAAGPITHRDDATRAVTAGRALELRAVAGVGHSRRTVAENGRILTSLVGSYAQPSWLIDRERLRDRFPPRVRATELWRIDPQYLEEGAGRRHARRDRRPGAGRAGHPHRRRDAPRELLQPLRHRARRRRRRQPGHRARPQRPSQPGPARGRARLPPPPGPGSRRRVPARAYQPHHEDHGSRPVHDVPAGAGRLLRLARCRRDGLRGRRPGGDHRPVRGRRPHRAGRRAVHAGPS